MNVTIFAGGTGSEELQKGLWKLFQDKITLKIIINGYDDGKSTGIVRKIYDNDILGPSDMRKNHLFQHLLRYGKTDIYKFMNMRFSSQNPKEYILNKLKDVEGLSIEHHNILSDTILKYFQHPNAYNYEYNDFNIGNIVYAHLFYNAGTQKACEVICEILNIPSDIVSFQSDEPYRLCAKTENGLKLETEEQIVEFANYNDKIISIQLLDKNNKTSIPSLKQNVVNIIQNSDIILFSCGTLWSSLIPTYISDRFYDLIYESTAKKYLITNINNDKDMYGCILKDYLTIYDKYLPMKDITLIFANNKIDDISLLNDYKFQYLFLNNIIKIKDALYDDVNLISQIFMDYFCVYLKYNHLILDYDYTIYDPNNHKLSEELLILIYELKPYKTLSILSGNSHKHIHVNSDQFDYIITNHGSYDLKESIFLNDIYLLPIDVKNKVINTVRTIYNKVHIEDRDTSICFKINDSVLRTTVFNHLSEYFKSLRILQTGKTSIEILKLHTSKYNGYKYISSKSQDRSLYITDTDDLPELLENKVIIKSMEWLYILLKTYVQSMNKLYLNDMIIVAGGTNSRMQHVPKLLMNIGEHTLLDYIIDVSHKYVNNIYVLTNKLYYHMYDKNKYNVLLCTGINTQIPNGNLETIHSGLLQLKHECTNNVIFMWSDCIPNQNIISEIAFIRRCEFLILCKYEQDPYAYLVLDDNNMKIERIAFKKDIPVSYGFHDMSLFNVDTSLLINVYNKYYDKEKKEEKHLFDIIPKTKAEYLLTDYPTFSFNTFEEYKQIISSSNICY